MSRNSRRLLPKHDVKLRSRLLFGSIILAVIVSVIFIMVAYRLSSDLGLKVERSATQEQLTYLSKQLLQYIDSSIPEALRSDQANLDPTVIGVWHVQNNAWIIGQDNARTAAFIPRILERVDGTGHLQIGEDDIVWAKSTYGGHTFVLLRRAEAFELALSYVGKRLSITAFLVFWLAVWAALIISSVITREFENNQRRLRRLATHDTLTKLPNRNYLLDTLHESAASESDMSVAILLIDLDRFKDVNDALGHSAGDVVLATVADLLKIIVPRNGLIVRLGGDEFAILLHKADKAYCQRLAEQVIQSLRSPIKVSEQLFEVGASVGIAILPQRDMTNINILQHADLALHRAKRLRLGYALYKPSGNKISETRVALKGQLSSAMANEQLVLYFQPKIDTQRKQIYGFEALIRWQHPEYGLLAPAAFIDLFERRELINELTRYVFNRAVTQLAEWRKLGLDVQVSVNISPYNLLDNALMDELLILLDRAGVEPNRLELELTESMTMVDLESTITALNKLKKRGLTLSLDDFGIGMSSLAHLRRLNIDCVKLDKQFVSDMEANDKEGQFVDGIIKLCHSLDKKVVAEGVETENQAALLTQLSCDFLQGFYYAKPMSANDAMIFIHEFTNETQR